MRPPEFQMEDRSPEPKVEEIISRDNSSNSATMAPETNISSSLMVEEIVSGFGAVGGSQHRAKAFILNTENNDWEEMATGICSPEPSEDGEVFAIRLRAEEDTSLVLFTAYFHKNKEIGVQNDTVLTWTTFDGEEAALSFESSIGCEEFWKLICRFYGKSFDEWKADRDNSEDNSGNEDYEQNGGVEDEEMGDNINQDDEGEEEEDAICTTVSPFYDYLSVGQAAKFEISFPEKPEISNLSEIEEALTQAFMIPSLRRQISEILIQYHYIPSLLEIFKNCEEFGMSDELGKLFRIFKLFFQLSGQELVKELLGEDHYLQVAGVMEYGFEPLRRDIFRNLLSMDDRYKQVIPINNKDILRLIHQTFRLQYFKDVILARILDEESSVPFIILIRLNHMAIINSIDNDPEILEVIRNLLQNVEINLKEQVDVLKFFKEFLTIAKTVSLRKSLQIHQSSLVNDFLKFITRVLNREACEDESSDLLHESKLLAIGLFTNFILHDPSQIRTCLIQYDLSSPPKNLLNTVIDMFTNPETCSPIRWQLVSALKTLLDTFNPLGNNGTPNNNNNNNNISTIMMGNPQLLNQALNQKSGEDFLNYFYPEYACRLLRPIIDFDKIAYSKTDDSQFFFKENLSESQCEILFHLGELLCNFIAQHKYRIKYLVLRNLILQNSLLLFKCREKHLQLTGLRIFRATLAVEDEFYFRFFIQHRSFSSIFSLYRASGGFECDNLVTSAILEIFEFIRVPRDSLKALVRHLASVYKSDLESLDPSSVFRGILDTEDRFDRESSVVSFASSSSQTSLLPSDIEMSPKGRNKTSMDEEEDYFSNIEDSDETNDDEEEDITTDDEEMFQSSKPPITDPQDEEEDHFDLLMKKSSVDPLKGSSPGSPTKKTKI